jgi:hypothetical protein
MSPQRFSGERGVQLGLEERVRPITAGDAAWLAAVPTAVVVVLAIVAFGPGLGHLLVPPHAFDFLPRIRYAVLPEPTEQGRFLISLAAPPLLAALTLLLTRTPPRLTPRTVARLVLAVQGLGAVVLVACFAIQRRYVFGKLYTVAHTRPHTVYFRTPSLVVAGVIAALALAVLRSDALRARATAWTAESRGKMLLAGAIAVAMIAINMLPAITSESSIYTGNIAVVYHLDFTLDEAMAVLDGRSPLGNFAAQYGSLMPYLTAGGMALFGATVGVFTTLMATISGLSLLSVYAVLRRITRRSLVALLLFVPLLATSVFMLRGPSANRYSLVSYFPTFPLRTAGPLLLAWLLARRLDGARPRRAWPLFAFGGLVALNNTDFGVPAVGATIVALLVTQGRPTRASLARLAAEVAVGIGIAFGLVTVLLLARTGSPPDLSLLVQYARLFAIGGFGMLPMRPVVGFSTVIYLTYVAAIGTAIVRALRDRERLLTGLLAWSGIFGLGAGAYYMGRSHPEVLTNMFPPWAFALTLLTIAVMRRLATGWSRRLVLPAAACCFGFGLLACSIAQTPAPWAQLARIDKAAPEDAPPLGQRFIAANTHPGERVVIFITLGHRIADRLGIEDVTPYTGGSILTREEALKSIAMLHREGGHKIFVQDVRNSRELLAYITERGFTHGVRGTEEDGMLMLTDDPALVR